MTNRRMLPVWILAAAVAVLLGILVVGWLRSPAASPTPSPQATPPSAASSATPSASLAPGADVLLAVGDTANCDNTHDDKVAALAASLPGEIALVGDLAYDSGSAAEYTNCFDPIWGPVRDRLRPAPGNHDYRTSGASAYYAEFPNAGTPGMGWYAYDIGSWRILVLNSNCDDVDCGQGSAQLAWLRTELAGASGCTLAYWHHPRYSSGMHGDNAFMEPIWSTAAAGGVDVVLGGHDHDYERLVADGVREFVVGTGGRSLYKWPDGASSFTEVRQNTTYGLLQLTLGEGTYAWKFLPADGDLTFTDSGTGECG